jgi:hypothetical protein
VACAVTPSSASNANGTCSVKLDIKLQQEEASASDSLEHARLAPRSLCMGSAGHARTRVGNKEWGVWASQVVVDILQRQARCTKCLLIVIVAKSKNFSRERQRKVCMVDWQAMKPLSLCRMELVHMC